MSSFIQYTLNHFQKQYEKRNNANNVDKLLEHSVWTTCNICIELCYWAYHFKYYCVF